MNSEVGITREEDAPAGKGSVWAPLEPPREVAPLISYLLASAVALVVAGLVLTVLGALGLMTGVLTSDGLSRIEFGERATWWVALLVVPLTGAAYLFAVRSLSGWFANRRSAWPDAVAALAITVACGALFELTEIGAGTLSTIAGCLAVALYLHRRAAVGIGRPAS